MSQHIVWTADKLDDFGIRPIQLNHGLHRSPLFSDAALARLIENSARENYYVNTMDISSQDVRSRREGEINGISGAEVLKAIELGPIWILLLNPEVVDPAYRDLVDEIYTEIKQHIPNFKPLSKKISILVSSPNVQVYYHCDVPGQTLWQIRGNKRVFVYPNREPYLNQASLERIVLNEAHEISLHYDPAFDADAVVFDLQPGQMLHWPLNAPHRVSNRDCVNVSFSTEHFTPGIRRSYVVNYANGILRGRFGRTRLAQIAAGPSYWGKVGVAGLYKLSGAAKKRTHKFTVDFAVDPNMPGGIRSIPSYEFQK